MDTLLIWILVVVAGHLIADWFEQRAAHAQDIDQHSVDVEVD